MGEKNVIHRFHLFNTQNGLYNAMQDRIQQTLYYAESRFWSILKTLTNADDARNVWCQKLLHRELVFVSRVNFYKLFLTSSYLQVICVILYRNRNINWSAFGSPNVVTITSRRVGFGKRRRTPLWL